MLEDRRLIWKYNRGRTDALRDIYDRYKDDMMTLATALLYDKAQAQDVVHEVFVSLIRSCGKLQIRENLKGYLAACTANAARNSNRAGQRQNNVPLDYAKSIPSSQADQPEFGVLFGERLRPLERALHQIPYDQREIVLLHLYSGQTFKAIAKAQNVSINTIQGRYRYGLTKLKALLNGQVEK